MYEHTIVSLGNESKDGEISKVLQELETKNYELVAVAPGANSTTRYFFKRPVDLAAEVQAQ
jgi:hypothetical protein